MAHEAVDSEYTPRNIQAIYNFKPQLVRVVGGASATTELELELYGLQQRRRVARVQYTH